MKVHMSFGKYDSVSSYLWVDCQPLAPGGIWTVSLFPWRPEVPHFHPRCCQSLQERRRHFDTFWYDFEKQEIEHLLFD